MLRKAVFTLMLSIMFLVPARAETVTRKVGVTDLNLAIPAGFCVLDNNNYRDALFIGVVQQLLQGTNKLVVLTADCAQLTRWRSGDNIEITKYAMYYLPNAVENLVLPGDVMSLRKGICNDLRKQGNSTLSNAKAMIDKKVKELSETASIDNFNFIGVVNEDNNGCYAALLLNGKGPDGKAFIMQGIMTATVIRSKLMFMALYDPYVNQQTTDDGVRRSVAVASELDRSNK